MRAAAFECSSAYQARFRPIEGQMRLKWFAGVSVLSGGSRSQVGRKSDQAAVPRSPFHARAEKPRILANVSEHTRSEALASSAPVRTPRSAVPCSRAEWIVGAQSILSEGLPEAVSAGSVGCEVEAASRTHKTHWGRWTDPCRRKTQRLASTGPTSSRSGAAGAGCRNVAQELSEAVRTPQ
jgi:hypothetical protein